MFFLKPKYFSAEFHDLLNTDFEMFEMALDLVGGSGPHEGNLVIEGRPVCDEYWNQEDANVLCRFNQGFPSSSFMQEKRNALFHKISVTVFTSGGCFEVLVWAKRDLLLISASIFQATWIPSRPTNF